MIGLFQEENSSGMDLICLFFPNFLTLSVSISSGRKLYREFVAVIYHTGCHSVVTVAHNTLCLSYFLAISLTKPKLANFERSCWVVFLTRLNFCLIPSLETCFFSNKCNKFFYRCFRTAKDI